MANEITISTSVGCINGLDRTPFSPASQQFDQTGKDVNEYTLTVTDAGYTALSKANITNLGLCVIHNLSVTAADIIYVSFDDGTTDHLELPPKAWTLQWLKSDYDITTLKITAAAGKTVLVKARVYEK